MQLRQQRTRNGLRAKSVFSGGLWQSIGGEGHVADVAEFMRITLLTATNYIAQELAAINLVEQTVTTGNYITQAVTAEE